MKIEIVQAVSKHAHFLAPFLRQQDKNEVLASGGRDPLEALLRSVELSDPDMCWTALIDGYPEVMWGVAGNPDNPSVGCVWLLSSEEMYKHKRRFLLESASYVSKMQSRYDTLFNYVHAVNTTSQKWLLSLGFTAHERVEEYGVAKEPFILFAR